MIRLLVALLLVLMVGCDRSADLHGTWQRVGDKGRIVIKPDGGFELTDNMGANVSGHYSLQSSDRIRFTVTGSDVLEEQTVPVVPVHFDALYQLEDRKLVLIWGHNRAEREVYRR